MAFMRRLPWLIVGAGFTGAVAARLLAEQGDADVLVVDRRDHIAGNAFDARNAAGVTVHRYGPHIFHTNSDKVFAILSRFTGWRAYEHRVEAQIGGRLVPLPFGIPAIEALFAPDEAAALIAALSGRFGAEARVPILKLRQEGDPALARLADFIYANVFEGYSRKQWDMPPEALGPGVTARVPVIVSRDTRYFTDRHQAMPEAGYTAMFAAMLDHPRITVRLNTPMEALDADIRARRTIYTGPLDAWFGRDEGALPYRSLRFAEETRAAFGVQPCGTVNFPNDHAYTRTTEMGWLTGETTGATTLVTEYPEAYEPGRNEPFYPVPTDAAEALADRYRRRAEALAGRVWFAGRLADYRYYNMDQAAARAMTLVEKEILPSL